MGKFDGKVAIVTGAGGGGVGSVSARRLAMEGCTVVLTDVKPAVVDFAEQIMKDVPGSVCKGIICDITKSEQVDKLVADTVAEFGKLDIMFNNAGINHAMCEVAEFEDAVFDRVININFRGVFNGCRAAIRQMIKQGHGGRIVNTASYYAKRGYAYFAPYCASKAAVVNFTRAFALEAIPYGIRVNCICPGDLNTEMHMQSLREEAEIKGISMEEIEAANLKDIPCGRLGTPDDIASALLYLCSDDCTYTIGEALNVSGGREMN